ncbi:synaptopodin-2 isoform X2 [Nothobranchius furzeri]|uniref:Transcript variant X1 n=1 Tax=Nothobranchius furzeri TaxID=105023 RepID=A0A9D3BPT2_NOTFU|nr:transcript variant X1 [Nothobranchius furzeri]
MDPEAEDLDNSDNLLPWSGSDGSQELWEPPEPLAASFNDDTEAEHPTEPQTPHVSRSDPDFLQLHESNAPNDHGSPQEHSNNKVSASEPEQDEIYQCESREFSPESPRIQTSHAPTSSPPERPDSEPHTSEISWQRSRSSSSSLGSAADMTQALTLSAERPQGTSDRQGPGTGNRRVESSEEGGSSGAPPAPVFFGISDEGAEQAERRTLGFDRDLCRPDGLRAKHTYLSRRESQSERHVKETKSKCKRIAQLLANAPNPQNKGALLFKKRRQRVKKYTLVSYGTGVHTLDRLDPAEREPDQFRSAGCNFAASSDSELEEQYSLHHQQRYSSLNWGRVREMEALAETKGKGVLMFAQRRKRMDELVSEHEEMMSRGLIEVTEEESQSARAENIYERDEMYVHTEESRLMDMSLKKNLAYSEDIRQMNHLSNDPKPLVPNRTAKPFLGFQDGSAAAAEDMPGGVSPVTKKHELQFNVAMPTSTNPKVWSPTGDIIASRDERISIPAIKTAILPETKRKSTNKKPSMLGKVSELHVLNKGDRRSYIEAEEDCFSLGAEACNFMQPRTIKLKNPPPVAPKPSINPACPPWMTRSSSSELYNPPRSPSHSPVRPPSQHYLQQQDWAQPQQMAGHWATDQTTVNTRVPVNSSSKLHLQPTTNSWSQQSSQSPVSMSAHSPTYSPHLSSANKSDSAPNLAAFCPPQAGKSHVRSSKASPKVPGRGISQRGDGPPMAGKGADMFVKRQSRMEKFVIDAETVQAHKARSPSPTSSLPNSWRYSSNIRAPPPVSYNPLLSPFHPLSASKQPPSTSPQVKTRPKEKPKPAPKQLNALDIMKHQPYQLDTSLFTYDATSEAKSPSPKPTPASKFELTKSRKQRSASSNSYNPSELAVRSKPAAKCPELVSSQLSSTQSTRSAEPLLNDEHLDDTLADTTTAHHTSSKRAPSAQPARTSPQHSSFGDSIASAFSPASLIARGVRQMAPRPSFSAKKPAVAAKQWKPVAMLP